MKKAAGFSGGHGFCVLAIQLVASQGRFMVKNPYLLNQNEIVSKERATGLTGVNTCEVKA